MARKVLERHNGRWATVAGEDGQLQLAEVDGSGQADIIENAPAQAIGPRIVYAQLENILPNRFQPRLAEDSETIRKLALDIARRGLLEEPIARELDGFYELAFGHTRLAAFRLLAAEGLPDQKIKPSPVFARMPLRIRQLTDQQLFEYAVAENVQRRDLNPIELAASMQRYMQEFGTSSAATGELFGLSGPAVRNLVRLLSLPDGVRQKVASGEINQVTARKLLSLAKIEPDKVEHVANEIIAGGNPETEMRFAMARSKKAVQMSESWEREAPRAGRGLWLLSEKPPAAPVAVPERKALARALEVSDKDLLADLMADAACLVKDPNCAASLASNHPERAEQIERLAALLHPGPCNGCAFHVALDRSHFCGFKGCHDQKSRVWIAAELQQLSKQLGIAVYNKQADGPERLPLAKRWDKLYKEHAQLVKDKSPDLRLDVHRESYGQNDHTGSSNVWIIIVGEPARKAIADNKESRALDREDSREIQKRWRLEGQRRDASEKFYEKHVPQHFAPAFDGLTNIAALSALVGWTPNVKGEKALRQLRIQAVNKALQNLTWSVGKEGPARFAKHLQGVAKTWGVELPADFLELAATYEPVSTETGGDDD